MRGIVLAVIQNHQDLPIRHNEPTGSAKGRQRGLMRPNAQRLGYHAGLASLHLLQFERFACDVRADRAITSYSKTSPCARQTGFAPRLPDIHAWTYRVASRQHLARVSIPSKVSLPSCPFHAACMRVLRGCPGPGVDRYVREYTADNRKPSDGISHPKGTGARRQRGF